MKNCPSPECGNVVAPHQFCCSFHWQRLPFTLKSRLNDLNYHLRREEVPVSEVHRCEADIRRAMNWESDEYEPSVVRRACQVCGREIFHTRDAVGDSVSLEETKKFTYRGGPILFIIGFMAVAAADLKGSYTPFQMHHCPALTPAADYAESPRRALAGSVQ